MEKEGKSDENHFDIKKKTVKGGTDLKHQGSFQRMLQSFRTKKSARNGDHNSDNAIVKDTCTKTVMDSRTFTTQTDATPIEPEVNTAASIPMVVERDAEEYNMNHARRGLAVIFNHKTFEKDDLDIREGTEKDIENLERTLGILKFNVIVFNDLTYSDILINIKKISREDFSDCDCIAVFVLTHGNKLREIAATDVFYPVEKLWEPFTADNCETLAGKPKLFFINACRGRRKDTGRAFFRLPGRTQADSSKKNQYKIPNHADFLIAYSTAHGYVSYRDCTTGTWFIECLCEALLEHHNDKDLLKILTITARKIALNKETISDQKSEAELRQISSFTSMLIRDVYLKTT